MRKTILRNSTIAQGGGSSGLVNTKLNIKHLEPNHQIIHRYGFLITNLNNVYDVQYINDKLVS